MLRRLTDFGCSETVRKALGFVGISPAPVRPHSATGTRHSGAARAASLLDQLLPEFDFGHRHAIVVAFPPAIVAEAAEAYRLDQNGSFFARLLFRLRGLSPSPGPMRASMAAEGFTVLAEEPGEEVVLGVAGCFWALDERSNLITVPNARAFVEFHEAGSAKAAVSIRFEALSDGATRLSTETRVKCVDGAAYRRFALYWALIKPFSEWLRRDMLRAIERGALEAGGRSDARA